MRVLVVTMLLAAAHAVMGQQYGCNLPSTCCDLGGSCGSPAFDPCDGEWIYVSSIKCNPTYLSCCDNYGGVGITSSPTDPPTTAGPTEPPTEPTEPPTEPTELPTEPTEPPTEPTEPPTEPTEPPTEPTEPPTEPTEPPTEPTEPPTEPTEPPTEPTEPPTEPTEPPTEPTEPPTEPTEPPTEPSEPPTEPTEPPTEPTEPPTEPTEPPTEPPEVCGVRPSNATGPAEMIIGGEESVPNSWPWAVSIEVDVEGTGAFVHHCGGALIDEQWVVTAATCVTKSGTDDPSRYKVVLRMHDKDEKEDDVVEMEVSLIISHEDFDAATPGSPNDVALLKFVEPIEYDAKMAPICLEVDDKDIDFSDKTCYITGWGLTKGTGDESVHREALIPVTDNAECNFKWELGSGRVDLITDSHICVGNGGPEGPGACDGDIGGPLSCLVSGGRWVLAGVGSFGAAGCVAQNAPDVYTRAPYFSAWIQDKVANN